MNWIELIKDLFKAAMAFVVFSLGRKTERNAIEKDASKKALEVANETFQKQKSVKDKYSRIKSVIGGVRGK